MPVDDILMECEMHMEHATTHLQNELRGVRTGRATPALVEHIKVDYYGTPTDIKAIAAISIPEATQILVKPFSPADIKAIEKAISDANIGLTAHSDGKQLRMNLPPMSQDRRLQMVGQCKEMGEKVKISIRAIRRDANKSIETEQKSGDVTEDESDKAKEQVQDLTKQFETKVDQLLDHKKHEIMQV